MYMLLSLCKGWIAELTTEQNLVLSTFLQLIHVRYLGFGHFTHDIYSSRYIFSVCAKVYVRISDHYSCMLSKYEVTCRARGVKCRSYIPTKLIFFYNYLLFITATVVCGFESSCD